MPTSVYLVDDEPEILYTLSEALTYSGFDVQTFEDGPSALEAAAHRPPDLLVTDMRMPEMDGMALLTRLRSEAPDTEVIILTGFGDLGSAVSALRLGAFDYLTKPIDANRLAQVLKNGAEHRRLQAENRSLIQRLRESNRIKTEFINGMSHEVRTPLGHILGFAQLLEDSLPDLSEVHAGHLQKVQQAAKQLLGLFDDILQFSILRSGEASVATETFPLGPFLSGTVELVQAAADAKGVTLEILLHEPDPTVSADAAICEKALHLILDNAVKFTPTGGGVRVSSWVGADPLDANADRRPPPEGYRWLGIAVADSGPGIPSDDLERIFNAFEQGDGSLARQYGGTGLGLALARSLARIHGGEVEVRSQPEKGSTFTLVVPTPDG